MLFREYNKPTEDSKFQNRMQMWQNIAQNVKGKNQ